MPLLWRYLITYFLKLATACMLAFIAILLTIQLDDIAHFAALGAPLHYIILFTFHQIPYILPIAIPLSCLIASLLLIQRLSATHELTALRASGFALRDILIPIWLTSLFLAIGNFWIASELATKSHLQTNLLKSEFRSINPLLLLNNKHLMRLKGYYFEALGDSRVGESASKVVLAIPSQHYERLYLMIAQKLKSKHSLFLGEDVTLITGMASEQEDNFDQLLIENMQKSSTNIKDFSDMLQKKVCTINNDYLQMALLLSRIQEQRELIQDAQMKEAPKDQLKTLKTQLNRSLTEITKRFSMAFAVVSFTLMGTSFGINISRKKLYRSLYLTITLTALYLIAFFVAKGFDQYFGLAAILYLAPHILMIGTSLFILRRIARGIE